MVRMRRGGGQSGVPRRRRRWWAHGPLGAVLVLLLVIAGLLLVGDRVAVAYAEQAVAEQVRQQVAQQGIGSSPPEVSIGGFPFLTQVMTGRYESISIVLRDMAGTVGGSTVRLPELDVEARGVHAPLETLRAGQGDVVAASVDGTATISYASVVDFIGQPGLRLAERDGRLDITAPVEILGQRFTLTGTGELTVSAGQVVLSVDDLAGEGLPADEAVRSAVNAYAQQFSTVVPVPQLPYQLRLQQVRAVPAGLAITATAQDVPLNAIG